MDGLYVIGFGRVKPVSVMADSYIISDGADPDGIKVVTQGAPRVNEGDFVIVTGAAGWDGGRVIYKK